MFKFLVTILLSMLIPSSQSQIVCDATEWDFGKISSDAALFHTFKLTNDTDKDFRIGGLCVSCSCVSAYTGKFVIKAGETIDMEVTVHPETNPGKMEHYVILYGYDEKKVLRFNLKYEQTNSK